MEFLFTIESLGLSFMEIRLGANGIGGHYSLNRGRTRQESIMNGLSHIGI